jgi:GT2 family glycosyltransferase
MKVRIGIITRNRALLLTKAIDSALSQDHPDKEVVVYDIASTDETPQLRHQYPQVTWLRSEKRLEMIGPKNQLMSKTDAEFYFSLDDDAWFTAPDQLSCGLKVMAENPRLAILAYDILLPGMQEVTLAAGPKPTHLFVACGALLRRSALEEVGYYRSLPAVYGGTEETDLCLRLFDAGYDVQLWRGLHVWHERARLGREAKEQHRSLVCNDLAGLVMNCPAPLLVAMLPWRILKHFVASMRAGELTSYFDGLRMFSGSVGNALRARSPVSMTAYREYRTRAALRKAR